MSTLHKLVYGDMEKVLEAIKKIDEKKDADLERLREENRKLREEYDKDEEVQKLKAEIDDLCKRSLLIMCENEKVAEKAFRDEHYKKCKNGNRYIYELTGTGLGTSVVITCPVCGEKKEVTDTSTW